MSNSLLILGCGGHGRVVADAALEAGYDEIAFLDDGEPGRLPPDTRMLGPLSVAGELVRDWPNAIAAAGDVALRLRLFGTLRELAFRTPFIVHPSAVISRNVILGDGVFVAAGAIIGTGSRIGEAAIVNTGARIDHDCEIGSGAHIAPGATLSGGVTIGERAWLGTGCSVRQGVSIGNGALVGVGAAVVDDLAAGRTYAGVPAKPMKKYSR